MGWPVAFAACGKNDNLQVRSALWFSCFQDDNPGFQLSLRTHHLSTVSSNLRPPLQTHNRTDCATFGFTRLLKYQVIFSPLPGDVFSFLRKSSKVSSGNNDEERTSGMGHHRLYRLCYHLLQFQRTENAPTNTRVVNQLKNVNANEERTCQDVVVDFLPFTVIGHIGHVDDGVFQTVTTHVRDETLDSDVGLWKKRIRREPACPPLNVCVYVCMGVWVWHVCTV